jgi:hypothetical protein
MVAKKRMKRVLAMAENTEAHPNMDQVDTDQIAIVIHTRKPDHMAMYKKYFLLILYILKTKLIYFLINRMNQNTVEMTSMTTMMKMTKRMMKMTKTKALMLSQEIMTPQEDTEIITDEEVMVMATE